MGNTQYVSIILDELSFWKSHLDTADFKTVEILKVSNDDIITLVNASSYKEYIEFAESLGVKYNIDSASILDTIHDIIVSYNYDGE